MRSPGPGQSARQSCSAGSLPSFAEANVPALDHESMAAASYFYRRANMNIFWGQSVLCRHSPPVAIFNA